MSQPYIGEIRLFGGNFAPLNWAFCNGQVMDISQFQALFQLIGIVREDLARPEGFARSGQSYPQQQGRDGGEAGPQSFS